MMLKPLVYSSDNIQGSLDLGDNQFQPVQSHLENMAKESLHLLSEVQTCPWYRKKYNRQKDKMSSTNLSAWSQENITKCRNKELIDKRRTFIKPFLLADQKNRNSQLFKDFSLQSSDKGVFGTKYQTYQSLEHQKHTNQSNVNILLNDLEAPVIKQIQSQLKTQIFLNKTQFRYEKKFRQSEVLKVRINNNGSKSKSSFHNACESRKNSLNYQRIFEKNRLKLNDILNENCNPQTVVLKRVPKKLNPPQSRKYRIIRKEVESKEWVNKENPIARLLHDKFDSISNRHK